MTRDIKPQDNIFEDKSKHVGIIAGSRHDGIIAGPQQDEPVTEQMRPLSGQTLCGPNPSDQLLPQYNVLVLGETQSGKSTLIQYMRKYADPTATIDQQALGDSVSSHTQEVSIQSITTDLPEYYVTGTNGEQVHCGNYNNHEDEHDYEASLNNRKNLQLKERSPRLSKSVQFNLIDTPGLNTTKGDDEKQIRKVLENLIDVQSKTKDKTFHLVIITIASGPFTQGLKEAIKCYIEMFPDFNGIIAFVHTRFNYKNLHPACEQESHVLKRRKASLHKIMGRTTFPHFEVDCDDHKLPIRDCITQNTIRKILELAVFNRPVDIRHTLINKTQKMRTVDDLLQDKIEAISCSVHKTLQYKDQDQGDLLAETYRCETKIHRLTARIGELEEFVRRHDVNDPELLCEERHDMEYEANGEGMDISLHYPETGEQYIPIVYRDILSHRFDVMGEIGQKDIHEPWTSWHAEIQRTSPLPSIFHVKIYTTKAMKYHAKIQQARTELGTLQKDLEAVIQCRNNHAQQNESMRAEIQGIDALHNEGILILGLVANKFLGLATFMALLDAHAYDGEYAACVKKVQAVYMCLLGLEPAASSQGSEAGLQGLEASRQELVASPQEPEANIQDYIRPEGQEESLQGQGASLHGQQLDPQVLEAILEGPEVKSCKVDHEE
ncbi:hypothetical protein BGZ82_010811 [Podila clonocystis]|nr:hypothetical protein BGZ82_010811 [Podila clonocystis]